MPRKFHEYTNLVYWEDYKVEVGSSPIRTFYQYNCPDYRFERLMKEVEDMKKELVATREILTSAQNLIHHSSVDHQCITANEWSKMWLEHSKKQQQFYESYPEGEPNGSNSICTPAP